MCIRDSRLVVAELPTLVSLDAVPTTAGRLALGVHGDDAGPWSFDSARTHPGLLVVGRSGTGVSTLLNTVARAAKHDGFKSIGISDGSAGLAEVADQWLPLRNLTAEATTSALESFDDEDRVLVVVDRVSKLSLIHISSPRDRTRSRMPSSA